MKVEQQLQLGQQHEAKEQKQEQQQQHRTLNHHSLYYAFIQRYFTTYRNATQFLHKHSNGLYLLRLRTQGLPSRAVGIVDVLAIQQVRGKHKRGGTRVGKNTVVVQIECENGAKVPVFATVEGIVLQKNKNLSLENIDKPQGYIIVIKPSPKFKFDAGFQQLRLPHQS